MSPDPVTHSAKGTADMGDFVILLAHAGLKLRKARDAGTAVTLEPVEVAALVRALGLLAAEAKLRYPTGTWAQRWLPRVCKHERVRCIHGDETIARRFRRRLCMVCGRALKGPLPVVCFYSPTGEHHSSEGAPR